MFPLVKLIIIQQLKEEENCIQPAKNFKKIEINIHHNFYRKPEDDFKEQKVDLFRVIKQSLKEDNNIVTPALLEVKEVRVYSGKLKIQVLKVMKINDLMKKFSQNTKSNLNVTKSSENLQKEIKMKPAKELESKKSNS